MYDTSYNRVTKAVLPVVCHVPYYPSHLYVFCEPIVTETQRSKLASTFSIGGSNHFNHFS
jgi:hypothetical protein